MRVAQVVHRVDERLVVPLELAHHFPQILRCDGIETEMHVEYLKAVAVFASPSPARASKVATNHPEPSAHRAAPDPTIGGLRRHQPDRQGDGRRHETPAPKPLATLSLLIGRTTDRHSPRKVGTQPSSGRRLRQVPAIAGGTARVKYPVPCRGNANIRGSNTRIEAFRGTVATDSADTVSAPVAWVLIRSSAVAC